MIGMTTTQPESSFPESSASLLGSIHDDAPPTAAPAARSGVSVVRALAGVAAMALAAAAVTLLITTQTPASSPSSLPLQSPRGADWDDSWRAMPTVTAADVLADAQAAVVQGADRFIHFGIGDWGRCGSPGTANPINRVRRCNEQRSLVPTMEAYAEVLNPSFMLSVGDQFYDGPMPNANAASDPESQRASADNDPIYDLSWRHIYDRPQLRAMPWYVIQGNHDYAGLLASQVNFGLRAPHTFGDAYDKRWLAPDLRYTFSFRMGASTDPRACVAFVALDTCPLMDNYRTTSGSNSGDPNRGARTSLRGLFQEQINNGETPASQMSWFAKQLRNASESCAAVVVTGHASIFSRGQHAQAVRQQDLRVRLNFPEAFAWAGVDAYLNDHIVEYLENEGTAYIVTGAGSAIRTNNAAAADDDGTADDDNVAPGNPSASLSEFLLEDNGFTISSFNATHTMHSIVSWNSTVVFSKVKPLLSKLDPVAPAPVPTPAGCPTANDELRQTCLSWLKSVPT